MPQFSQFRDFKESVCDVLSSYLNLPPDKKDEALSYLDRARRQLSQWKIPILEDMEKSKELVGDYFNAKIINNFNLEENDPFFESVFYELFQECVIEFNVQRDMDVQDSHLNSDILNAIISRLKNKTNSAEYEYNLLNDGTDDIFSFSDLFFTVCYFSETKSQPHFETALYAFINQSYDLLIDRYIMSLSMEDDHKSLSVSESKKTFFYYFLMTLHKIYPDKIQMGEVLASRVNLAEDYLTLLYLFYAYMRLVYSKMKSIQPLYRELKWKFISDYKYYELHEEYTKIKLNVYDTSIPLKQYQTVDRAFLDYSGNRDCRFHIVTIDDFGGIE